MILLIATRNAHKTAEIAAMLGAGWQVGDLISRPDLPSPEETGATFEENAAIKAVAASHKVEGLVLADDSGLEVDALGGAPGVYSARYAGPDATDADNRIRLLAELRRVFAHSPAARFRCAMVLAHRGEVLGTFSSAVEGSILDSERGAGGFGYDSLFVPHGETASFGELPAAAKNAMSHRARALAQVIDWLQNHREILDSPTRCS